MSTGKEFLNESDLVLGFTVNQYLVPKYWVREEVNDRMVSDLIVVPARSIDCHTAIIAQSGSGKSFFLGRLVEEIVLRSKSRCLIFDPNGDFSRIHNVVDDAYLCNPKSFGKGKPGKLTHEESRSDFSGLWNEIGIRIQTQTGFKEKNCKKIEISLNSFTMDMLAEELDPYMRPDLFHCHEFVKNLTQLMGLSKDGQPKTSEVLTSAKSYLKLKEEKDGINKLKEKLKQEFPVDINKITHHKRLELIEIILDIEDLPVSAIKNFSDERNELLNSRASDIKENLFYNLERNAEFVSEDVAKFYFSKASSLKEIIEGQMARNDANLEDELRLDVINLQTLVGNRQAKLVSVNAIIEAEWNKAIFAHDAAPIDSKLDEWGIDIMSATDEPDKQKQIDEFKAEPKKNTRTVLIVAVDTDKPKAWTIAMFNDQGKLINKPLIDDGKEKLAIELAIELNKYERGRVRIIELAALYLGLDQFAHDAAPIDSKLDEWGIDIMSAIDEPDKQKQIDEFKAEPKKNTRTVLIVAVDTDKPKAWTIAMFNDQGKLINKPLIDDGKEELATELNTDESGRYRIIEFAALYLGRPILDYRVPTFIVVDEAHNLIPFSPRDKAEEAVRNSFRKIVAEGRKYGLFLILVSQQPDKLDAQVLSECENKAIMKLSTDTVLTSTRKLLGLEDVNSKMMEKCLEFERGRALLVGPWVNGTPQFMYCAARRTEEGGKSLQKVHWAVP